MSTALETIHKKPTGRGGARAGSGRKRGSANVKTREIADRAAELGVTPLSVMLEAMMEFRAKGDMNKAAAIAATAAPFCHPRLSALTVESPAPPALSLNMSAEVVAAIAFELNRSI